MYQRFNFYQEAKKYLDNNPKSKLVCWSYGVSSKQLEFVVFIPKEI